MSAPALIARAKTAANLLAEGLLELVYPARCAVCDKPGTALCDSCERELDLIDASTACPRCGAPFGLGQCVACSGQDFAFSAGRAVGSFDNAFSLLVTVYKDGGERRLAEPIARLMARAAGASWRVWADAVVFVPDSADAFARRGFDHMELIASPFAGYLRVPLLDVVVRGAAADQRGLGRSERADNTADSFSLVEGAEGLLRGRRVLLLDDVFTTGATLHAVSRVLLDSGAREVRALVLARVW